MLLREMHEYEIHYVYIYLFINCTVKQAKKKAKNHKEQHVVVLWKQFHLNDQKQVGIFK